MTFLHSSADIAKIAPALIKAQAHIENAVLNKTNPHFKSKYADLSAVRDATAPTLANHDLCIMQTTKIIDDGLILITTLLHSSGQWLASEYPVKAPLDKPQAIGSALTYARRYSWAGICGIAAEEDDDGNAAQGQKNKASKAQSRAAYTSLTDSLREAAGDKTTKALEAWSAANKSTISALPDDWQNDLRNEYRAALAEIEPASPASQSDLVTPEQIEKWEALLKEANADEQVGIWATISDSIEAGAVLRPDAVRLEGLLKIGDAA